MTIRAICGCDGYFDEGCPACTPVDAPPPQAPPAPLWVWHADDFASLMLGRIQIAQISYGKGSGYWSWALFFCKPGERAGYSTKDKARAMAEAEAHAQKVLTA